ncbi:MAG TPA: hypothetical protein VKB80_05710 [Kofleriaceae bacterium]|nr:hypothetical protein [Kofleriaceae bacterium]
MLVIFGTRYCGEVDSHCGQGQLTRFFHIYHVPIVPLETKWMTEDLAYGRNGHDVAWSIRSVVAGYMRTWGPLVALGGLAGGGSFVASAALLALTAWTWTWRWVRGERERRRCDHHMHAFGTRCDPLRMKADLATRLRAEVAERWARAADGRTPEDVARLGAANPTQAVLAYASLRLAARLAPAEQASKARAASERVLDACKDADLALAGGPYRSTAPATLAPGPGAGDGAGR